MNSKNELIKQKLMEIMPDAGVIETDIKGLTIARKNYPTDFQRCFYHPTCILLINGEKQTLLGSESFCYNKGKYVVSCTDIPVISRVVSASPDEPCIAIILALNPLELSKLLLETQIQNNYKKNDKYIGVADVEDSLSDAFYRLVELLDKKSSEKKFLAPVIMKEIYYRILIGPLGNQLRLINTKGTQSNQILEAINFIKSNYKEKLNIDYIAQNVNMTSPSFYRNFKRVTKISPLQYLKQLRLYEAQRLMISGDYDATEASYEVGYESPTQFSREYKKMFGNPPLRNIKELIAIN